MGTEVVLLENIIFFPYTHDITQPAKASACQMIKGIWCSTIYLRVNVQINAKEMDTGRVG